MTSERDMVSMPRRFRVSPDVRSTTDGDGSTILHISQDKIYSIIGVGSRIWERLVASAKGLSHSDIVKQLSDEFHEVPRRQIETDVDRLLLSFQDKKLILTSSRSDNFRTVPGNLLGRACFYLMRFMTVCLVRIGLFVSAAFLGLATIDILLTFVSFQSVCNLIKSWPVSPGVFHPVDVEEINDAVARAMTWYPKQAMCLQRSAVITCLLRSSGANAQMIIGCQKLPFLAHAWVELDGEVVNDRRSVQGTHEVLDRC